MESRFEFNLRNERPAGSSLLLIFGFVVIGMVIGNVIATFIMIYFSGSILSLESLISLNSNLMSSSNGWLGLLIAQAFASVFTFIISGLAYFKWIEKKGFQDFNFRKLPNLGIILLSVLTLVSLLPFNGWLQEINSNMKFPASLSGLEIFLKSMEDSMAELTKFMTGFDEFWELILALLVIGLIAGIGEELIFRGLLQRKLYLAFNNPHLAIWISAVIFSAIHMQFYGFLPRMFLGAILGYLYYYSGNLWIAILGHVFNNCLAVTMLYLVNLKIISPEIEKLDSVPVYGIIGSLAVGMYLFYTFKNQTKTPV